MLGVDNAEILFCRVSISASRRNECGRTALKLRSKSLVTNSVHPFDYSAPILPVVSACILWTLPASLASIPDSQCVDHVNILSGPQIPKMISGLKIITFHRDHSLPHTHTSYLPDWLLLIFKSQLNYLFHRAGTLNHAIKEATDSCTQQFFFSIIAFIYLLYVYSCENFLCLSPSIEYEPHTYFAYFVYHFIYIYIKHPS